ncbi:MAG: hypothetical protein GX601_13155, partial [Anaerolineales bacterium]|nr:hypothetical protein [Anaerolineales bacterium]
HYPGFGVGSFMFANIAAQIVGYYLLALIGLTLGWGHLRLRRWARPLTLALLGWWLIAGIPLLPAVFFILAASKDLTLAAGLAAGILLVVSYAVVPALLIRFYRSRHVVHTFEAHDAGISWIDRTPVSVLTLAALGVFGLVALHIALLLNGVFPLFGRFVYGMNGVQWLAGASVCLAILVFGVLRRWLWAWWGMLIYTALMACSTVWSLAATRFADLLVGLAFPAREMEMLGGLPFGGYHLAALVGLPLLLTLGLIMATRRHFTAARA